MTSHNRTVTAYIKAATMRKIEEMPDLVKGRALSTLVSNVFNESFGKLVIDLDSETLKDFQEWAREENLPVEVLIRKVLLDKWRARCREPQEDIPTPRRASILRKQTVDASPVVITDVPTPALPKAPPSAAPKTMLERILARQQKSAGDDAATPTALTAPSHNNNEEA